MQIIQLISSKQQKRLQSLSQWFPTFVPGTTSDPPIFFYCAEVKFGWQIYFCVFSPKNIISRKWYDYIMPQGGFEPGSEQDCCHWRLQSYCSNQPATTAWSNFQIYYVNKSALFSNVCKSLSAVSAQINKLLGGPQSLKGWGALT